MTDNIAIRSVRTWQKNTLIQLCQSYADKYNVIIHLYECRPDPAATREPYLQPKDGIHNTIFPLSPTIKWIDE